MIRNGSIIKLQLGDFHYVNEDGTVYALSRDSDAIYESLGPVKDLRLPFAYRIRFGINPPEPWQTYRPDKMDVIDLAGADID